MTRSEFLEQITVRMYFVNICAILIAKEAGVNNLLLYAIASIVGPAFGIVTTCFMYFCPEKKP